MEIRRLLIANRGEIAARIARSASELGIETVGIHASDERRAHHLQFVDRVAELKSPGLTGYLDVEAVLSLARSEGCDALHPGYGFLSERPEMARGAEEIGIRFLGPTAETLALFADKRRAREAAADLAVPVLPASTPGAGVQDALRQALEIEGPVVIKAALGGGGRGMHVLFKDWTAAAHPGHTDPTMASSESEAPFEERFEDAWRRCARQALSSFGSDQLYVERLVTRARHIEVQVVGDGRGSIVVLGDRDCTLQRRHQKIVEIAPAPALPQELRRRLHEDAARLAGSVAYRSLGTFEFLVEMTTNESDVARPSGFAFIECNPRIQVEHTVTEQIYGLDLVQTQIEIAEGATLSRIGLDPAPSPRGCSVQCRINAEVFDSTGLRPTSGVIERFQPPQGLGIRVDSGVSVGSQAGGDWDPLLAKVIVHSRPRSGSAMREGSESEDAERLLLRATLNKAEKALSQFTLEGAVGAAMRGTPGSPTAARPFECNLGFQRDLLAALAGSDGAFDAVHTRWIDEQFAPSWAEERAQSPPMAEPSPSAHAGVRIDNSDPLAVLAHGRRSEATSAESAATNPRADRGVTALDLPEGLAAVAAPMQGTVLELYVEPGQGIRAGQVVALLEAMKMEHEVRAPASGTVNRLVAGAGESIWEGSTLFVLDLDPTDGHGPEQDSEPDSTTSDETTDLDRVRPDLQEVLDRQAKLHDAVRPEAVARRRKTGQRTVRENVEDLVDDGSWIEYGGLVVAAQRRRRELQDLIDNTPADGLVAGIGTVNGDRFADDRARCAVLSYDYTVLAGTQGKQNHHKKDRLFHLAQQWRLPVVFFTEGGGGRPGDTDALGVAGLDCWAFRMFGELSGLVPLVGINSGRCFAGNAALLGCCDVVIATANSTIGMGGPAMIEGGGLGIFKPEEVGPMSVQVPNGVVDIAVEDEAEAVAVAKQYLSYFQGPLGEGDWSCTDPRHLRHVIPENRLRVYDVRRVIELLADEGSVLELRRAFGVGMITAFARIEGQPLGILANNPQHLAGAIDSPGADKAARFLQLCDAFDIPVLMLCDTPGIMVGPETEKTASVRHCSRLFVTSASMTVPVMTIVLRKGYGLGAQAMAAGSFKAPLFTVAWPTGEFGGMGLEGAVKLGYRKELAAIEDPEERRLTFERMVAESYERGKAINTASHFELDDVIDPAESRRWISRGLASVPAPPQRVGKKRPCVDTW